MEKKYFLSLGSIFKLELPYKVYCQTYSYCNCWYLYGDLMIIALYTTSRLNVHQTTLEQN